eukprot:CAMPEP_0201557040 /NCGR_PEP_ID=MMETSP0173_2-20130828/59223_1 /ASSEMBLY_ACC=CAM_ASM_000268 /TAXON_ID=218659 /ORGANISM="Vexillifera sp., Strain DIVA3 564/2" /LENGTH=41 /DNA_ID= /DNA_START= /DNA_END= /DNA_ORIENTATION=
MKALSGAANEVSLSTTKQRNEDDQQDDEDDELIASVTKGTI